MKKIILLAAVAGFAAVSCKKDYTCECTVKDSSGKVVSSSTVTFHATKGDAEDACNVSVNSGGASSTCALKD